MEYEVLKRYIEKVLHVYSKEISVSVEFATELGADSIDILQLLMTLEETKGITIPDEELMKFSTVKDIVDYLEARV